MPKTFGVQHLLSCPGTKTMAQKARSAKSANKVFMLQITAEVLVPWRKFSGGLWSRLSSSSDDGSPYTLGLRRTFMDALMPHYELHVVSPIASAIDEFISIESIPALQRHLLGCLNLLW